MELPPYKENSINPNSLAQLLNVTKSLRTVGTLSLRQLVPVYQSLVLVASSANPEPSTNEVDVAKALDDATYLLVIQWLSHYIEEGQLAAMALLVLPSPPSSVDLLDAILDALLAVPHENQKIHTPWIDYCVGVLLSIPPAQQDQPPATLQTPTLPPFAQSYLISMNSLTWETSCHILGRLVEAYPSQVSKEVVVDRLIQYVTTIAAEEDAAAGPVVRHILPLLQDLPDRLWTVLREHAPKRPIEVTTILCSLLPQQKQPVVQLTGEQWLWDLIYDCISTTNRNDRSEEDKQTVIDSLLRRRGLFLLDAITPEHASWKRYVACFETLVMETATHLHEQVWGLIVDEQFAAEISFQWMEPLLRCAVLENPLPLSRKLALQRLFEGTTVVQSMPVDFWMTTLLPAVDALVGVVGLRFATHNSDNRNLLQTMGDAVRTFLRAKTPAERGAFIRALWGVSTLHFRTAGALHEGLREVWEEDSFTSIILVDESFLENALITWKNCVSFPVEFQTTVLESLSLTLSHATPNQKVQPRVLLEAVAIFTEQQSISTLTDTHVKLWLQKPQYSNVATAVPSAFVDGALIPDGGAADAKHGFTTPTERRLAAAIIRVCGVTTDTDALWPSLHKGLQRSGGRSAARALVLLHYGCQAQILSGMGNGGLVVTANRQVMMPPPPGVETLLFKSFRLYEQYVRALLDDKGGAKMRSSRSDDVRTRTETFQRLLEQCKVLVDSFPSSEAIGSALDEMSQANRDVQGPERGALLYMSLKCGIGVPEASQVVMALLDLATPRRMPRATRSIFQLIKWGALSLLLPDAAKESGSDFWIERLQDAALDAVTSVPTDAVVLVFDCIKETANLRSSEQSRESLNQILKKCIGGFFGLLAETEKSTDVLYMVDGFAAFLFQPRFLIGETKVNETETPVYDTFRKLIEMAGGNRPYYSRAVLSRLCASWLSGGPEILQSMALYRDDLFRLLLKKEDKVLVCGRSRAELEIVQTWNDFRGLGDETSVSRFFILVMLSRLPHVEALPEYFVSDVLHFLIKQLFAVVLAPPEEGETVLFGTAEYSDKLRSLQALCVLSRFVTVDIAEYIGKHIFEGLGRQNPYHEIRYFVEVFTLQCARKHPRIFAPILADQMARTDMWAPEVASLMVIVGNLLSGSLSNEFLSDSVFNREEVRDLREKVLAGVVRWLSSTLSLARGIAQLLAFKLIPQVTDVGSSPDRDTSSSSWYLVSVYKYLLENADATRLREKQIDFFESFDIDTACSPEGLSTIPIDVSGEANPKAMVEVIDECLRMLMYRPGAPKESEFWIDPPEIGKLEPEESEAILPVDMNLQRKIIPVDSLNLALENAKEQRQRNLAGRRNQDLIVCAALVDKLPNLGGLCRTAEIFAAEKLVIPDKSFVTRDLFTSLSVGAADWIDIEECKEKDLLSWLKRRRKEGYHIVGIEQTSSSTSLSQYKFPSKPTVLLLGKEREGIPVKYLQAVDECLEIPQLGVIRSLNVHVSGAISVWEFSKQRMEKANCLET